MVSREANRLVSTTGAEPHDQAEVAEEHERRKDDHLCQRALAGGIGDGRNFLRLSFGKSREFLRVQRNASGSLDLFPNQSSGVLTSVVWGDGVIDNPSLQVIKQGDWVRYFPFADWLQ